MYKYLFVSSKVNKKEPKTKNKLIFLILFLCKKNIFLFETLVYM